MILSDNKIREFVDNNKIVVEPEFDLKSIRPAGIRLHLGGELLIPKPEQTVDVTQAEDLEYDQVRLSEKGYTLESGQFILGSTYERVQTPRDLVAVLDGRSTIARIGLAIHCTSATIDGNFEKPNAITLEIKNEGNFKIILKEKMPIGMLVFHELTSEVKQDVQLQYKDQSTVKAPNLKNQLK